MRKTTAHTGFSLVEVVFGVSIMLIVFSALLGSFQSLVTFGEHNRLRAQALLIANEHLEIIRALPYDNIGTIAGLPHGSIPQLETIIYDDRSYTRRTFIQYVDDAADGLGAADTLAADYKRIKVEISYDYQGTIRSFALVTTVAPKSQESLIGAGILRVVVNDVDNNPISGALVHTINTTVATSVDITTFTNASGTVSLPGAWAGAGYEVYVSKANHSGVQTYTSTTTNPNPSPSPLTVGENTTTEFKVKIDELSSIALYVRDWPTYSRFFDSFSDTSQLTLLEQTQTTGGALTLSGAPGTYASVGTSTSVTISPASLGTWVLLTASSTEPANTSVQYQLWYDTGGGVFAPIPNSDLAGNETGLTAMPVALTGLSTSTYTSLRIVSLLDSTDPLESPHVYEYALSYEDIESPRVGTDVTLEGLKTIGTDSGGDPIYKYAESHTTNASGKIALTDMEFDEYAVTLATDAVAEACPALPLVLDPDTAHMQTLTLDTASAHSLAVTALHPLGNPLTHAEIYVTNGAIEARRATGPCGVAYFPNLTDDTYTISIQAAGLADITTTQAVSGTTETTVTLSL